MGEEVLNNAGAYESMPAVDDMTKIAVELHIDGDRRYGANEAQTYTAAPAKVLDKWGNILSKASVQALAMFKSLKR